MPSKLTLQNLRKIDEEFGLGDDAETRLDSPRKLLDMSDNDSLYN